MTGSSTPGDGRWDRVVPVEEAQSTRLGMQGGLLVGPTIRPPAPAWASASGVVVPGVFLHAAPPWMGLHRLLEVWAPMWQRWRTPLVVAWDVRGWCREDVGRSDERGVRARAVLGTLEQPGVLVERRRSREALQALACRARALLFPYESVGDEEDSVALPFSEGLVARGVPAVASASRVAQRWVGGADAVEGWRADAWISAVEGLKTGSKVESSGHTSVRTVPDRWPDLLAELLESGPPAAEVVRFDTAPAPWRPPPLRP